MTRRKVRKLQRGIPNPDTLEVNMKQVVQIEIFPTITSSEDNIRRHSRIPKEPIYGQCPFCGGSLSTGHICDGTKE